MYRDQRNYENLNRAKFIGAGAFDIPRILAEVPATPQSWIGFNYAKSCKDPANKAVQIWNHYRKHWLGAYWQGNGITVIPTISWSDESSFEWCFDGEPVGGAVAVSSVGTQLNKRAAELFRLGYDEMLRRLNPSTIYFYGLVPEGISGPIVHVAAFQEQIKARTTKPKESVV